MFDDADYCVYCGQVLLEPPNCCKDAMNEYREDEELRWKQLTERAEAEWIKENVFNVYN
jgi:hypothetical protein